MRNKARDKRCFTISYFHCPDCDKVLTVPRMKYGAREKGHMKDLYCPFCKETKTLKENRYCDYYKNALGEVLM